MAQFIQIVTFVRLPICSLSLAVAVRRMVKTPIAAFSTGRTYKQNYLYVTAIKENRFLFLCLLIIIIVTFSTEIYKLNRLITNSMAYRFISTLVQTVELLLRQLHA